jgi:hypothetical protein
MSAGGFEQASGIVEAVQAGASLPEACDRVGVKFGTARGWLRKGRLDAAGRYGEFAAAVHAAGVVPVAEDNGEPLTREEVELLIARSARAGSVPALRLWLDLHRADGEASVRVDPFARFDELAAKRGRSRAA